VNKKIDEYQPTRHTLMEPERKCPDCGEQMKVVDFQSHPIADQVWVDWECSKCKRQLNLRYEFAYEDGIHVTER
jgi:hypothetical protein